MGDTQKKERKLDSKYLVELAIKSRRVQLQGVIDEILVRQTVEDLLMLDSINHDPITLFINSPGCSF